MPGSTRRLRLGDAEYELRRPRLSDAQRWRAVRTAERARLEAALARPGMTWEQVNSPAVWVEHVVRSRAQLRRGTALHFVVVEHRAQSWRIVGEVGLEVQKSTATGELAIWIAAFRGAGEVARWAVAAVTLSGFAPPYELARAVGPVSVTNPRPNAIVSRLGFTQVATRRRLRVYGGQPEDHYIWMLDNTEQTKARLQEEVAR